MSTNIILIENRDIYKNVLSLNLKVYVDADVYVVGDYIQFVDHYQQINKEDIGLVVIGEENLDKSLKKDIQTYFQEKNIDCPTVVLGDNEEEININGLDVKPLLQAVAKILGVTAEIMASKKVNDYYPFKSSFFPSLEKYPCDIFAEKDHEYIKVFEKNQEIEKQKIMEQVNLYADLFVEATKRLIFVNHYTSEMKSNLINQQDKGIDLNNENFLVKGSAEVQEGINTVKGSIEEDNQVNIVSGKEDDNEDAVNIVSGTEEDEDDSNVVKSQLEEEIENYIVSGSSDENEEHLQKLANELEDIASVMVAGGIPEDIADKAQVTIKGMMNFAMQNTQVSNLIKNLKTSPASFRYRCCQLMVFLGMYVLREIGMNKPEDTEDFSNAAFYHDLILPKEEMASVRDLKKMLSSDFTKEEMDILRNHALETSIAVSGVEGLSARALLVIKEHHGNKDGTGFSENAKGIDPLSKVFVIIEHWAHTLLLTDASEDADLKKYFNYFSQVYQGTAEQKIVRALFKLESLDIINGVTLDLSEEIDRVKGNFTIDEEAFRIANSETDPETQTTIGDATLKIEEGITKIPGLREELNDEWMEVKFMGTSAIKQKGIMRGIIGKLNEEISYDLSSYEPGKNVKALREKIKSKVSSAKEEVKKVFEEEAQDIMNARDSKGRTKLMLAAMSGNLPLVNYMLEKGSDTNAKDKLGRLPIHFAAMSGSIDVLKKLYELNPKSVKVIDSKRRTPLFMACHSDHIDAVKYLVDNDSRVDVISDGGVSLLMIAAYNGSIEVMDILIENGININKKDDKNKSAMNYAKMKKQKAAIEFLSSKGLN